MKERPILMSAPMVRAIRGGRKTQTRRVLKLQPKPEWTEIIVEPSYGRALATYRAFPNGGTARWGICNCPFGKWGDRLWVRETHWRHVSAPEQRDGGRRYLDDASVNPVYYKKTPSIHMPRWASRITLEIIDVRVEQLQAISTNDCIAEGAFVDTGCGLADVEIDLLAHDQFRQLWDSLNAKRGFGWDANPWVWVIGFQRIKP